MTTELLHIRAGETLRHAQADLPSGLYRILIPAGTHLWRVGVSTYLYNTPARGLAAFDAPPVAPGEPLGTGTQHTLERLWGGATLAFYSPENSGTLSLSAPESTSTFRADRDRWLYLQLEFPAGKALSFASQIVLHSDQAPTPAPQPAVSPELAQRALAYAQQAGLIDALRRTSGATTDDELIDWAMAQGDLWPSICRMVEIVEAQ